MAERMNSAMLLQLIRETTPGVYNINGDRLVMTCLRGDFAPEEAWASFRPSGFNEDAWHAMERTHSVWQGTIRWDFKQAHVLLRMLCGAPASDVTEDGVRTRVYALPETGARDLDGSTYTIEYGVPSDCDRCPYGLIVSIALPAERNAETVEGQITMICQKPTAEGVTMTGVAPANEVQRITFNNTPIAQFLQLRAEGGSETFDFKSDVTTGDLKAGIEGLEDFADVEVTIVDNRSTNTDADTGESRRSGYLQLTFDAQQNVPQIQVLSGEVQRLVVTNGDGGNYALNGGANFTLGATEGDLQTNQRTLGGDFAAVVVKGVTNGSAFTVEGAGDEDFDGVYVATEDELNGAPIYAKDESHFLYKMAGVWFISSVSGVDGTEGGGAVYYVTSNAMTPPLTGWGMTADGVEPAPTLEATTGSAHVNTYFPVAVGNVDAPTATGTGAVASTVQTGGLSADNTTGSTTNQGTAGLVVEPRVPMLNRNFSLRRASQLANLDAATPLNKSMMMNFDIGGLVDPIWFFDENEDTFLSHVDGAEPSRTLSVRLAKTSSDLAAVTTEAKSQPAQPKWWQLRAVHADDSDYSFRAEFYASATGAITLGAGGNVRYVEFPLATVIHGDGHAVRFVVTEPA